MQDILQKDEKDDWQYRVFNMSQKGTKVSSIPRPLISSSNGNGRTDLHNNKENTCCDNNKQKPKSPVRRERPVIQGPFRPEIVGKMPTTTRSIAVPAARSKPTTSMSQRLRQASGAKSPVKKEEKVPSPTRKVAVHHPKSPPNTRKVTELKSKVQCLETELSAAKKQISDLESRIHILGEQETLNEESRTENERLLGAVEQLQKKVVSCNKSLERLGLDPVTLQALELESIAVEEARQSAGEQGSALAAMIRNMISRNSVRSSELHEIIKAAS